MIDWIVRKTLRNDRIGIRILTLGMSLYISRVIDRRSPILFCPIPLADFHVKPISFPPPPISALRLNIGALQQHDTRASSMPRV